MTFQLPRVICAQTVKCKNSFKLTKMHMVAIHISYTLYVENPSSLKTAVLQLLLLNWYSLHGKDL